MGSSIQGLSLIHISMLGDLLHDFSILERVKSFLDHGYYQIALKDIGWCTENGMRTDLIGEANDAAELMEACICLGNAGDVYKRQGKIFSIFYSPYSGISSLLESIGITALADFAPLGNESQALYAAAFVDNWHFWGFVLVLMMSALHQVDTSLYCLLYTSRCV